MTFVRTHIHKCEFGHVFIREWAQVNAKGVIHIHHGMMEHSGMYHAWAKELNHLGWTVIAHDQPGFGYSVINECDRNHISVKASSACIQVGLAVESWIRAHHPQQIIIRYGHSMGAFSVLGMQQLSDIRGIILTGLMHEPYLVLTIQRLFLRFILQLINNKRSAKLAHFITFKPLLKTIKKPKTDYDWVSRNDVVLSQYLNDPFCGNVVSWATFFVVNELLIQMNKSLNETLHKPVLILTGQHDALSKGGKKLTHMINRLKKQNQKVNHHIISGARHKVENDCNKALVLNKIETFLEGL
jgi:alpha-beta hydrolase superfamily lysophospholipase